MVSFSQSVGTTFTASAITVTGGTLTIGSFAGSGAGAYTFTVTPNGAATVPVSLETGVATDANNTGNTARTVVSVLSQPLELRSISPVTELPGQVVTRTGTGFISRRTVRFGTTVASATEAKPATTLTVAVLALPTGLASGNVCGAGR